MQTKMVDVVNMEPAWHQHVHMTMFSQSHNLSTALQSLERGSWLLFLSNPKILPDKKLMNVIFHSLTHFSAGRAVWY